MTKPVEFFFDFISPYGWFAAEGSAASRAPTLEPLPGALCCSA